MYNTRWQTGPPGPNDPPKQKPPPPKGKHSPENLTRWIRAVANILSSPARTFSRESDSQGARPNNHLRLARRISLAERMDPSNVDHQAHLRTLAEALDRVCSSNVDLRGQSPTVFDAVSVPAMSVHCYLVRMHRYTKFDFVCFHVAAWYLHKLGELDAAFCPTLHNIHRLLVTALLVASKATDGAKQARTDTRKRCLGACTMLTPLACA